MAESVRLRDGTDAMIWPLLPTDRNALREQYEHLSPPSQFRRFLRAVPHLTDDLLNHLVDNVDGVDHVALVLFAFPTDDAEVPAGIARMIRYPNQPTAVDVAVTVADAWQGRGVATALLDALRRHRPPGVTDIITEVASDNTASLAMLERVGAMHATPAGNGCWRVIVHLDHPTTDTTVCTTGGSADEPAAPDRPDVRGHADGAGARSYPSTSRDHAARHHRRRRRPK